ncbi:zinc finger protein 236 isoform X2 [Folsomia candida]|uniref:zinc finger protein 236 isoform X2 n=1 Tax=Folsomia candida TaxID=158441 RepID=UPI00160545E2|nr:zinc finger protein 236 isoform X2 [Folsomia candida]
MRCCVICSHKFRQPPPLGLLDGQLCSLYFIKCLFPQNLLSSEQILSIISSGQNPSEVIQFCKKCQVQVLECKTICEQIAALQEQYSALKGKIKDQILLTNLEVGLGKGRSRKGTIDVYTEIRKRLRGDLTLQHNSPPFLPPYFIDSIDVDESREMEDIELFPDFIPDNAEETVIKGTDLHTSSLPDEQPSLIKRGRTRKKKTRQQPVKKKNVKNIDTRSSSESELETKLKDEVDIDFVIKEEPVSSSDEYEQDIKHVDHEPEDRKSKPRPQPRVRKKRICPPRIIDGAVVKRPIGRPRVPESEKKPKSYYYKKKPRKEFNCPLCSAPWKSVKLLINHLKIDHDKKERIPKFKCDVGPCSKMRKAYFKEEWLRYHQKNVHMKGSVPPTTIKVELAKPEPVEVVVNGAVMMTSDDGPQPAPTNCTEQATPTNVTEQAAPIISTEQPAPISSTEQPAPISSTEQPAPISSIEQPAPISSTEQLAPISSTEQPVQINFTEQPAPIIVTELSEQKHVVQALAPTGATESTPSSPTPADLMVMSALEKRTCPACYRILVTPNHMQEHYRHVHNINPVNPFMCHICPKAYKRKSSLDQHIKDHDVVEPLPAFACESCPRRFRRKVDLEMHSRIHTGDAKLFCSICSMGFRQHFSFKRHNILRHGSSGKSHVCKLCGKSFKMADGLRQHLETRSHGGGGSSWLKVKEKKAKMLAKINDGLPDDGEDDILINTIVEKEEEDESQNEAVVEVVPGSSSSMWVGQWAAGWYQPNQQ